MFKETDVEIWKDIEGFENQYAVSTKGRVRNLKTNRILVGKNNRSGYKFVSLNGKGYKIHRLVALAFIPNPNKLPQVDHLDENKGNNDVSNLRWVTASENQRHSAHQKSCQVKQFDKNGNLMRIWNSLSQIEKELGYFKQNISNACKGKLRYSHGYMWEYADSSSQIVMNRPVIVYKGSEYIGTFASAKKAAKILGLCYTSVNKCLRGYHASNKGYIFKYLE